MSRKNRLTRMLPSSQSRLRTKTHTAHHPQAHHKKQIEMLQKMIGNAFLRANKFAFPAISFTKAFIRYKSQPGRKARLTKRIAAYESASVLRLINSGHHPGQCHRRQAARLNRLLNMSEKAKPLSRKPLFNWENSASPCNTNSINSIVAGFRTQVFMEFFYQ